MARKNANSAETRKKLVDAGTRLFAELGFRAVSTRDIAREAGVNSALISYHFGGKDGIFEEVVRTSAADHVAERMHQLTIAQSKGSNLDLQDLLRLYLSPLVNKTKWATQGDYFSKLHAVLVSERPDLAEDVAARAFNTVNAAFIDEIGARLPHLTREVVIWRFYSMIGTLLFLNTSPGPPGLLTISGGKCDSTDPEEVLRQIMPFLLAGLSADAPEAIATAEPSARAS